MEVLDERDNRERERNKIVVSSSQRDNLSPFSYGRTGDKSQHWSLNYLTLRVSHSLKYSYLETRLFPNNTTLVENMCSFILNLYLNLFLFIFIRLN